MSHDASIEEFAAGGAVLAQAIAGLDDTDLSARPVPGTWSIGEIVVHLLDAELIGVHRMKSITAENLPLMIGYDETAFINNLSPEKLPVADVLAAVDLNRRIFAATLRGLPASAFERAGIHNEVGRITLGEMLEKYNKHLSHHLKFVREKRAKLGK
ncbi:MAG TPA: DinB family protein [Tepidisphaeraceae bacterium]|jgi:hypothetical protein